MYWSFFQSNLNGLNTLRTMKICSRQEKVEELESFNHNARTGCKKENDIFSILFKTKVYCVFSLESPHRGDSNEYT